MYKKIILSILLSITCLFTTFCGSENSRRTNIRPAYRTFNSVPSNWQQMGIFILNQNNAKYIAFSTKSVSKRLQTAMAHARMSAFSSAAMAIKMVVRIQVVWIEKQLENGRITRKVKEYLETRVSKNVRISGLTQIKSQVTRRNGLYEYYSLYTLDYNSFKKLRNNALQELKQKRIAPYKRIDKIIRTFAKID